VPPIPLIGIQLGSTVEVTSPLSGSECGLGSGFPGRWYTLAGNGRNVSLSACADATDGWDRVSRTGTVHYRYCTTIVCYDKCFLSYQFIINFFLRFSCLADQTPHYQVPSLSIDYCLKSQALTKVRFVYSESSGHSHFSRTCHIGE
jgi:hypothetical protein